jgi:hypothetical protein
VGSRVVLIFSILSTCLNPIAAQAVDGTGLSLSFKTLSGWSTPPSAVTSGACATTTDYLNYDWGNGSPLGAAGCGTDNFIGYGTGYILAPYTGTVSFCAQTDDQSYLKINNQVVINDPTAHGPSTGQNCNGTGSLEMVAGNYYPVEAWVHENGGGAVWRLLWFWPGNTTKEIGPKIILYPSSFNPDTTAFNGLSLAGAVTSASYRTAILITADISVASKVTFKLNGKVIPGCRRRLATGSGSSFTVTCNWRPSMRGSVTLVATANPVADGIPSATATPIKVFVNNRTGPRGG